MDMGRCYNKARRYVDVMSKSRLAKEPRDQLVDLDTLGFLDQFDNESNWFYHETIHQRHNI